MLTLRITVTTFGAVAPLLSPHVVIVMLGYRLAQNTEELPDELYRVISITTKSPYAVSALAELARRSASGPVPLAELAKARDIPVQFLEQLFAVLRRAGMLKSQRGVKGGYRFQRDPSEITVLEVVELLDGSLSRDSKDIFGEAAEAARNVLESATIADIAERESAQGSFMYYI